MSTSPLGPEDIRAAAEVHRELGPEYDDAVVAAFLDKVDREVAARVQARLGDNNGAQAARRTNRRSLVKGVAIGMCASGLIGIVALGHSGGVGSNFGGRGFPNKFEHAIRVPKGNFYKPVFGAHRIVIAPPKKA
jgi:hypothetical protein